MPGKPFNWRNIVADYFIFSKGQRRAAIFFSICLVLIVFVPAVYRYFFATVRVETDGLVISEIRSLSADSVEFDEPQQQNKPAFVVGSQQADESISLFYFDPNNTSFENWQKLGVRDKTIRTIENYLAKGGHFYKAEDLKKVYGLTEKEAERLIPFVRLSQTKQIAQDKEFLKKEPAITKTSSVESLAPIEINSADSLSWIRLPGIGPKLASRIMRFRENLGGFYSIEQVGETYGLPDSSFQKVKPLLQVNANAIKKRNINSSDLQQLRSPYIPFNVANAIINYRNSKGNFSSLEDLKKIPLIDEPLYRKISPYLTVESSR